MMRTPRRGLSRMRLGPSLAGQDWQPQQFPAFGSVSYLLCVPASVLLAAQPQVLSDQVLTDQAHAVQEGCTRSCCIPVCVVCGGDARVCIHQALRSLNRLAADSDRGLSHGCTGPLGNATAVGVGVEEHCPDCGGTF